MRHLSLSAVVLIGLSGLAGPVCAAQADGPSRMLDVLPAQGLDMESVFVFREQKALDAQYFLADDTVLGLHQKTEAVFARYLTGAGEALLLVVAYPSEGESRRVYERFGRHFFSPKFDPKNPRFLEQIETGDHAGAVRVRNVLIVVLEAPDRESCEGLLRGVEAGASGLFN